MNYLFKVYVDKYQSKRSTFSGSTQFLNGMNISVMPSAKPEHSVNCTCI